MLKFKRLPYNLSSASEYMERDIYYLNEAQEGHTIYLLPHDLGDKSITYGCFVNPMNTFKSEILNTQSYDLAKRPTGGGAVLHAEDRSFGIVFPKTAHLSPRPLDSTQQINTLIIRALKRVLSPFEAIKNSISLQKTSPSDEWSRRAEKEKRNCCMAQASSYDIVRGTHKVVGSAQRRVKGAVLHQAVVWWKLDPSLPFDEVFLYGNEYKERILKTTQGLLPESELTADFHEFFLDCLEDEINQWIKQPVTV